MTCAAKLAHIIGPRSSEYAQQTQSKVDVHGYPSRKQVVKEFTRFDFLILGKKGCTIRTFNNQTKGRIFEVRITWRIQKNRRNSQKITVVRDFENNNLCPVLAAFEIYSYSIDICQGAGDPMIATVDKNDKLKYLTNGRIATLLRTVARKVIQFMSGRVSCLTKRVQKLTSLKTACVGLAIPIACIFEILQQLLSNMVNPLKRPL